MAKVTKKTKGGSPKRPHKKRTYPAEKKYVCTDCGNKYYFPSKLKEHMLVHTGEKPYKCGDCDKAFNTHYSLKTHKYIHTNEKPFKCAFCEYACRDCSTLRKHQLHKHMGVVKIFQCKMCDKSYKSRWQLKEHVSVAHLRRDVARLPCAHCGKLYKNKSVLTQHVKNVHFQEKACRCPVCNKRLTNRANLPQHLMTHVDDRPYRCTVGQCQTSFKDSSSLRKHSLTHLHEQHPCPKCGLIFPCREKLRFHERRVHVFKQKVQCDYCKVRFLTKNYLIKHIKQKHAKRRKKFICDICRFKTYNKPSLVMHIKHGHGNENDRECRFCHTIYKKYIYLKAHYKNTHNISYKTKKRRPPPAVNIKEEPIEEEDQTSIDLFEIEKQEPPDEETGHIDDDDVNDEGKAVLEKYGTIESVPIDVFDQFYVEHITKFIGEAEQKQNRERKSKYKIDAETRKKAKKSIEKILEEARWKQNAETVERARQVDERMEDVDEGKTVITKIKMFNNTKKRNKISKNIEKSQNDNLSNDSDDETLQNIKEKRQNLEGTAENGEETAQNRDETIRNNGETTQNGEETGLNIEHTTQNAEETIQNTGENGEESVQKSEKNPRNEKATSQNNENISRGKISDKEVNSEAITQNSNETTQNNEETTQDETSDEEIDDENDSGEEWTSGIVKETKKVKFNTHQCYVCFKLFETKAKLIDHCKEHFDICNDKSWKKCPLCDYVTHKFLAKHLKKVHDIKIRVPSQIHDKKTNEKGCRYYLKVNNPRIKEIEVIPSIRNLNKMASGKIDEENRRKKSIKMTKTKLVRKGKEWVVEEEKLDIGDAIIPQLDHDALKDVKEGDDNSYFDGMRKLYYAMKKNGQKILFPCQKCEKICQNLCALKLHYRKHNPNAKPFKTKVWKHKLQMADGKSNSKKDGGAKNKNGESVTEKPADKFNNDNRIAKPKPIKNNHKCDYELQEFYKNNIRGGDIEFWQFLKIFNKLDRENIKDFKDLNGRYDFGIGHHQTPDVGENVTADLNSAKGAKKKVAKTSKNVATTTKKASKPITVTKKVLNKPKSPVATKNTTNLNINKKKKNNNNPATSISKQSFPKTVAKLAKTKTVGNKTTYKRVIRINKEEHNRRKLAKEKLRQKLS